MCACMPGMHAWEKCANQRTCMEGVHLVRMHAWEKGAKRVQKLARDKEGRHVSIQTCTGKGGPRLESEVTRQAVAEPSTEIR